MFRYKPTIYLPKPGSKDIYQRLLRQCENLRIPVVGSAEEFEKGLRDQDVIMDAIFGGCGAIRKSSPGSGLDTCSICTAPVVLLQ
jgi:NAD(P)H-hydrate repair Nnr-like enzyme with NAD(P)H-hydrate epimerase domain